MKASTTDADTIQWLRQRTALYLEEGETTKHALTNTERARMALELLDRLETGRPPRTLTIPPFTPERRAAVDAGSLKEGELPPDEATTPEQLAFHVARMVCSFWSWPGNPYSDAELVYRLALGALRRMAGLAAELRVDAGDVVVDAGLPTKFGGEE